MIEPLRPIIQRPGHRSARGSVALSLVALSGLTASAQNLLLELPTAPSGYSRTFDINRAIRSDQAQGLEITGGISATYDSNLTRGSGTLGRPIEGDFALSPGINLLYSRNGSLGVAGVRLAASYDDYFDYSDYGGLNYDLSVFGGYGSGKFTATYFGSIAGNRGVDLYSLQTTPSERISISNRAILNYQLSPKTSLTSTISHSTSLARTSGYADSSAVTTSLSALWHPSRLVQVGAGARYALRTGENRDDVSRAGPILNFNYQLSRKVQLRSTFGLDFQLDPSGGDESFNSSVALRYEASPLWNTSLTYYRDSISNPLRANALDEISSLRLAYERKLRRYTLGLGVGWTARTSHQVQGGGTLAAEEFDLLSLNASLTVPFGDSAELKLATRYQDLDAGLASRSWDGWQTGLGFSWKF